MKKKGQGRGGGSVENDVKLRVCFECNWNDPFARDPALVCPEGQLLSDVATLGKVN